MDDPQKPLPDQPQAPEPDSEAPTVIVAKPSGSEDATVVCDQHRTVNWDNAKDGTIIRPEPSTSDAGAPRKRRATSADSTQGHTLNPLTNTLHAPYAVGGDVIKDRFIIEQVLGQGGMGIVCRAIDLRKVEADDQQPYVAIKLLSADFAKHADAFKSLQREAKKTQALAHPNIITVYDFDRDNDTIFMTMEVLEGYPLDAIIKGKTDLVLDRKTALKIIRQIALALEYAHSKGIIHSDLKPGNIYYTNSGQVKVLDFGIARAINSGRYTDNFDAGALNAITPKYASLEMFERQPPDPRDDIYALGLIAAELLCRKHPYKGEFATEVKAHNLAPEFSNLPGFLYAQWLSKAVRVDRDQRTQSASKFLSQLNWAEKGPLRVTVASLILTLLLVANFYYIESVDTAVPLSELPQAEQQLVRQNLASADQALGFKDYNGALIYLERAYEVHPSNKDIKSRVAKILTDFEAAYRAAPNAEQQAFLAQQLRELADYDFIARNKDYTQLVTTLSTQR